MIEEKKLGKVLSSLKSEFQTMTGDPEVFLSRVADLAPELDKERFILRLFLVFDGYQKLNKAKSIKDYRKNIIQICGEMNHQFGIDKQDIAGVCIAFVQAAGVNLNAGEIYETVSPKPVVQQTPTPAPATPSAPVQPVASAPVSYQAERSYHQGETGLKCSQNLGPGFYRAAAGNGHIEAAFAYAECCRAGQGVKADLDEAKKWYTDAAKKGHTGAQLALADLYQDNSSQAEAERRAVYRAEGEALDNRRLADILPRYNHMTYDARAVKHAFAYLLLALHAFLTMLGSAMVFNTPDFNKFPLCRQFADWLSSVASGNEYRTVFWVFVMISCQLAVGIARCCRLDPDRKLIFYADNSSGICKLRKFLMYLTVALLAVFSFVNPVTIDAWRLFGPSYMDPVINLFHGIYIKLGILSESGRIRSVVAAMGYFPVLLSTCTVMIAFQARTYRRFNRVLYRHWLLPAQQKKHRLVQLPVWLAVVILVQLGLWAQLDLALPLCFLLLLIPKEFYF